MPDYTHLTKLVTTAGECVIEEVVKDARMLLAGPSEGELLAYCAELDNVIEILLFQLDELQNVRIQARVELKRLAAEKAHVARRTVVAATADVNWESGL